MPSYVAWMDYSDHQRRRMMEVIDQFRERETRDELGLGTIRDGLADLLFPGTSTIQTRARYFLFVPWIYRRHEQRKTSAAEIARRARADELDLIGVLKGSSDPTGTIGLRAGKKLKRLPSSVYWNGMQTWGICRFSGPQDAYHRSVDRFYVSTGPRSRDDDGNPTGTRIAANWDPRLPPAPDDFPGQASFALTFAEASYLRDQVRMHAHGTYLHFLTTHGRPWQAETVLFPWQHPQAGEAHEGIKRVLRHARIFSELMLGASLLYNLLLARDSRRKEEAATFEQLLEEWDAQVSGLEPTLGDWDIAQLWDLLTTDAHARVTEMTRLFVERWLTYALSPALRRGVTANPTAQKLIQDRERLLKGKLTRLGNLEMLGRWSGSSGAGQLDYRWPRAQQIVLDVLAGLGGPANA